MNEKEFPPLSDVWMDHRSILDRAWLFLNDLSTNPDTVNYFYAALELRFAVEAIFFRILIDYRHGTPSREDMKLYKPRDFDRVLRSIEPAYMAKAAEGLGWKLQEEDIEKIKAIYGKLGSILHLPKTPLLNEQHDDWKLEVEQIVFESFEYLCRIIRYPIP